MKVTVRKVTKNGKQQWCVDQLLPDGRKRKFFDTRANADTFASDARTALVDLLPAWEVLSADEKRELIQLRRAAIEVGATLRQVFDEWRAGRRAAPSGRVALSTAIHECLKDKRAAGRREVYADALESALSHFARGRESMPLDLVTPQMIRDFAGEHSKTAHTCATWHNRLSALFSWAVRKGYASENPVDRMEKITPEAQPVQILTVRQTAKALVWTKRNAPRCLAWLALALLAGLRPDEADKITWRDVNTEEGTVSLDATKTKTRTRRVVHLTPVALAWIQLAKSLEADLPIPPMTRRRYIRRLRDALGFKDWPKKILRKTCASYMMASKQDAGKVADELGHSAGVLLRTYRALVSKKDSERWLKLIPRRATS